MMNKNNFKKDPVQEIAPPTPLRKPTIDAMLDKMSDLISQRNAWANLAKLLMLRAEYDSEDPEINQALIECMPSAFAEK